MWITEHSIHVIRTIAFEKEAGINHVVLMLMSTTFVPSAVPLIVPRAPKTKAKILQSDTARDFNAYAKNLLIELNILPDGRRSETILVEAICHNLLTIAHDPHNIAHILKECNDASTNVSTQKN